MIYCIILKDIKWVNNYEFFILLNSVFKNSSNYIFKNSPNYTTYLLKPTPNLNLNLKWKENSIYKNTLTKQLNLKDTNTNYLFLLYLKFANGDGNNLYIHADYRYMFMCNDTIHLSPYIDIYKFHKKWIHSYNLLINLFFADTQLFAFSSKLLKEETLSFNWSFNLLSYTVFKRASPYFFLKDCNHGSVSTDIYRILSQTGLTAAFISDTKYQKRTLFYLRINGIHTIGLVPYTISPWIVNYAIPAASNTLFTQYFFIKLLTYIRQQAECYKFNTLKNIWYFK